YSDGLRAVSTRLGFLRCRNLKHRQNVPKECIMLVRVTIEVDSVQYYGLFVLISGQVTPSLSVNLGMENRSWIDPLIVRIHDPSVISAWFVTPVMNISILPIFSRSSVTDTLFLKIQVSKS